MKYILIFIVQTSFSNGIATDHIEFRMSATCENVLSSMKDKLDTKLIYGECIATQN